LFSPFYLLFIGKAPRGKTFLSFLKQKKPQGSFLFERTCGFFYIKAFRLNFQRGVKKIKIIVIIRKGIFNKR